MTLVLSTYTVIEKSLPHPIKDPKFTFDDLKIDFEFVLLIVTPKT